MKDRRKKTIQVLAEKNIEKATVKKDEPKAKPKRYLNLD
jgi:hypothetical protein